jgi:hypothetical protein
MTKTATPEQIAALRTFAEMNGRKWKSALLDLWMNGGDVVSIPTGGCYLRQVRNTLGPSWLAKFKL